jgi:2,3-bisphosphoglycerate-dependent phosphoglycerate mutase
MSVSLVLLRHGESAWNRNKRFTGWTDVDLTRAGRVEAERAGLILKRHGYVFDLCFTSCLRRAAETARIVLSTMEQDAVPVRESWRLNERHYGALQGLSWWRAVLKFGPLPVMRCQRSFAARPPLLDPQDLRFPGRDPRYAELDDDQVPRGESIRDTLARSEPFWDEVIEPEIRRRRRILIVSHRNTLCALVKRLEQISDSEFVRFKIPTGEPLIYELDEALRPQRHYYLNGD